MEWLIPLAPSCPKMSTPESSKRNFQTSEETIEAAGAFGRYQIFLSVVLQYSAIIGAGTFALGTLGRLYPTYHCANIKLDKEDYGHTHSEVSAEYL